MDPKRLAHIFKDSSHKCYRGICLNSLDGVRLCRISTKQIRNADERCALYDCATVPASCREVSSSAQTFRH